jgi:hypothetical protein
MYNGTENVNLCIPWGIYRVTSNQGQEKELILSRELLYGHSDRIRTHYARFIENRGSLVYVLLN